MVDYKFHAKTEEEADTLIKDYLQDYHPAGYGTYVKEKRFDDKAGEWFVHIRRGSTCD